ncbi:hypothetical protein E2C01_073192 [Portunus trituberculatus]|uniref:Uncharacterized protein n=1 Tax=Portunus trituberculatus TaxID=210409 RepID=A0A5B7ICP8_PORTR|nr:hypothetical protein [Portunus trituberculatus]
MRVYIITLSLPKETCLWNSKPELNRKYYFLSRCKQWPSPAFPSVTSIRLSKVKHFSPSPPSPYHLSHLPYSSYSNFFAFSPSTSQITVSHSTTPHLMHHLSPCGPSPSPGSRGTITIASVLPPPLLLLLIDIYSLPSSFASSVTTATITSPIIIVT